MQYQTNNSNHILGFSTVFLSAGNSWIKELRNRQNKSKWDSTHYSMKNITMLPSFHCSGTLVWLHSRLLQIVFHDLIGDEVFANTRSLLQMRFMPIGNKWWEGSVLDMLRCRSSVLRLILSITTWEGQHTYTPTHTQFSEVLPNETAKD